MATDEAADDDAWAEVGRSPFVSLATYRRSGAAVPTPVWIAADGDALVVTTEVATGKVKRLRNDPRVRLQPCSRLGRVEPGATTVHALGRLLPHGAEESAATGALARKYGLQYRLFLAGERLLRRLRRQPGERVVVRITRA